MNIATTAGNTETVTRSQAATPPHTLQELIHTDLCRLMLLLNGNAPKKHENYQSTVTQSLTQFEKRALEAGKSYTAIQECKYACCALIDEIILGSDYPMRTEWQPSPLQYTLFGDHLAGHGFFERLDRLRLDPTHNIELIEVFYNCLLLGFKGKYTLDDKEKLDHLKERIEQEIKSIRGSQAHFAPNGYPSAHFKLMARRTLPLWSFFLLLTVLGLALMTTSALILHTQLKSHSLN